LIILFTRFS